MGRTLLAVLVSLALTLSAVAAAPPAIAAGSDGQVAKPAGKRFGAVIRRTRYGVPHIEARNWTGLGFGYAYAFAEDNICTIADSYVTVDAQRSRYFGPDASWTFSGNGSVNNNLSSDFFYERINKLGIVEDLVSRPAPEGPAPAVRKLVRGYVAGYNRYLHDTGVDGIPDSRCRGADWVHPITELEVYRRFHQLGSLASAGVAIEGIADAAPVLDPAGIAGAIAGQDTAVDRIASGDAEGFFPLDSGSNALGLGRKATSNRLTST